MASRIRNETTMVTLTHNGLPYRAEKKKKKKTGKRLQFSARTKESSSTRRTTKRRRKRSSSDAEIRIATERKTDDATWNRCPPLAIYRSVKYGTKNLSKQEQRAFELIEVRSQNDTYDVSPMRTFMGESRAETTETLRDSGRHRDQQDVRSAQRIIVGVTRHLRICGRASSVEERK